MVSCLLLLSAVVLQTKGEVPWPRQEIRFLSTDNYLLALNKEHMDKLLFKTVKGASYLRMYVITVNITKLRWCAITGPFYRMEGASSALD